jgi:hypothetical protein
MSIELNVTPRELDPKPLLAQLAKDRDVEPAYAFLGKLPVQSAWQDSVPASMLP